MAALSAVDEPAQVNSLGDLLKPEFSHLRLWMPDNYYEDIKFQWVARQPTYAVLNETNRVDIYDSSGMSWKPVIKFGIKCDRI